MHRILGRSGAAHIELSHEIDACGLRTSSACFVTNGLECVCPPSRSVARHSRPWCFRKNSLMKKCPSKLKMFASPGWTSTWNDSKGKASPSELPSVALVSQQSRRYIPIVKIGCRWRSRFSPVKADTAESLSSDQV